MRRSALTLQLPFSGRNAQTYAKFFGSGKKPSSSSSSSSLPSSAPRQSLSSESAPGGAGGMRYTPAGIAALHDMEDRGEPIRSGRLSGSITGPGSAYGAVLAADDLASSSARGGGRVRDDLMHRDASVLTPTVLDPAAAPLLTQRPEDSAERARRLRHYKPVTLLTRERIVDDSPHKSYHRITPEAGFGERVDDFLLRLHPDFSHDTLRRLVEGGHVYRYREGRKFYCRLTDRLSNGEFLVVPTKDMFAQSSNPDDALSAAGAAGAAFSPIISPPSGDVYESLRTGSGEAARAFREQEARRNDIHLSYKVKQEALDWVLFKNQYCIVINKPSGIPVQPTADGSLNVTDMLPAWKFTNTNKPLICNNLDQDTSGIVVLARTHDTHRMLGRMFQKRAVPNTVYWAFCVGTPKAVSGRIKMHLETPPAPRGSRRKTTGLVIARTEATPDSRVAMAEFVVNASANEYASFISFYPMTSRQHQLRIMAAHALRCPIVGDGKFGGESAFPENLDALLGNTSGDDVGRKHTKLHLHHRKIQLPYKKKNGEFECISAPMPEHMKATFRRLGWATNLDDPLIPS